MSEEKKRIKEYIYTLNPHRSKPEHLKIGSIEYSRGSAKNIATPELEKRAGLGADWFHMDATSRTSLMKNIFEEISRELRPKREDRPEIPDFEPDYWDNIQPLRDIINDLDLIYDIRKDLLAMSYDTYVKLCPKDLKVVQKPCTSIYNPIKYKKSWVDVCENGESVIYVNRYVEPEWRKNKVEGGCPELIDRFLKHLIPNETCRRYLLNWVRNALVTEGNGTYLVFNAAKGVGKNLFANIVKELVGQLNYGKANRGFLTKEFNTILRDKRLVLIDELPLNTNAVIDQVKDYINKEQNLEGKGVDANKVIRTYNSFIICNNRETDIRLDQDDRRFSVMDTTSVFLPSVMSEEDIGIIDHIGDYPAMVAQFGWWILDQCESEEWSTEQAWKGARFDHLVKTSLYEWNNFIVDKITSQDQEEYEFISLTKEYKTKRTSNSSSFSATKLIEFLTSYKHEGHRLGRLVKRGNERYLIPNKHFKNIAEEEEIIIDEVNEDFL